MTEPIDSPEEIKEPTFPLEGGEYTPIVNETREGKVYAHSLQTILAPPKTLYRAWSAITEIPRWQENVISVTPISATVSHWVMGNPEEEDGKRIEFDSEIVEDLPDRKIAWQSITNGIDQSGEVTFTPHPSGRGTVVLLRQTVKVPGGILGNAVAATAKRGPTQTVIEDLRHFKQMIETGEIPSVKGQPHGPRGISGGIKQRMYGENNPTPPGTSDQA